MMRFSCFSAHVHGHKSKKTVPASIEAMHKSLQDSSQIKTLNNSTELMPKNPSLLIPHGDSGTNSNDMNVTISSSIDRCWKSEERMKNTDGAADRRVYHRGSLKKSQSLGTELYKEGRISENDAESENEQVFSSDDSHDLNGLPIHSKNQLSHHQEDQPCRSFQVSSDLINNESIFSIGDSQDPQKECHEELDAPCDDFAHDSVNLPAIVKSCSFPNIGLHTPMSVEYSPLKYPAPRSRSSLDLHVLEMRRKEKSVLEINTEGMQIQGRDDGIYKSDRNDDQILVDEAYDSYNYVGSAKDWIMPVPNEVDKGKNLQGESSSHQRHDSPSKDFKTKRIEDWVTDLQHCNSLEESEESSLINDQVTNGSDCLNNLTATKLEGKAIPGMGAAKKYISSLSPATTTAQLANHGLSVVPFLSAFASLKVLNLSGNAIGRITAGALPRGLHMLNMSKNNISTIEGLREHTRLRILDLSYNRILRLGHGLASCSSMKELYLAGNKISEVEGLHRLLKLNVLDLRFNKISTAKSLGQLAANYNSLQAISLEGNPAQKNVGDEQLKKYLQGLLTHLAYYNRQPIKVSTLKDSAERTVRLGTGSHQFDRGLRPELKPARKSSHGVSSRTGQAIISPKLSRGRHGARLPPTGTKSPTNHRHHYLDLSKKIMSLRQELSIQRSRSEGTLAAL